jgi:hypothetical protein
MRIARFAACWLIAAFAVLGGVAWGQSSRSIWPDGGGPYAGVDVIAGTPSALGDVFRSAFVGASLRFIASRNLEFSLDYAFMDIEYYYPETGSGPWRGPVPWSSVPPPLSGMKDGWIFYHTKHFIAPQVWYIAPLEDLGLPLAVRVGAGPAISFLVPSEAALYYPGLSDAFEQFRVGFQTFLGMSLRLGLEYRLWNFARLGIEYLFIVDSFTDMAGDISRYGLDYFNRAGNFLVFAGARL